MKMNHHHHFLLRDLSLIILFICFVCSQAFSQTNATLVSEEEARKEARQNFEQYGFENIYFSLDSIRPILQDENCHAVRFYTCLNEDENSQTQVIVGIDQEGNELKTYMKSNGLTPEVISAEDAKAGVERSEESSFTTVCCTYLLEDLNNFVIQDGASGIHIKPGKLEQESTLTAVAARISGDGSGTGDMGTMYLKSTAPCPTMCGDGFLTDFND